MDRPYLTAAGRRGGDYYPVQKRRGIAGAATLRAVRTVHVIVGFSHPREAALAVPSGLSEATQIMVGVAHAVLFCISILRFWLPISW